jgi:two-component system cell cycle response regulator DivK
MTTVLIIEDNPDHVNIASRVLTAAGYTVLTASDAETGLQMATVHHPDVIMLDLGLPDLDGQTLLGQIRRVPKLTDIPVVAVTGWPLETGSRMAKAYGFDGYISKPLNFKTLGEQVAEFLPKEKD